MAANVTAAALGFTLSRDAPGRSYSPDNRGHISLTGWKVGTSFVPTSFTHNPWDDFMSFSVTFKNGYGGYSKNGKQIEHKKQFVFQEPAVGAK